MKNNLVIIISTLALVLSVFGFVYTNSVHSKSVYINVNQVYSEFELTKELSEKLESSKKIRATILDSIRYSIQIMGKELEASSNKNNDLISKYKTKVGEYEVRQEQLGKDQQLQNSEYDEKIKKQLNQYIIDLGKEKNYTIIVGGTGTGNVMYADESIDITKEAIAFINSKYQGE